MTPAKVTLFPHPAGYSPPQCQESLHSPPLGNPEKALSAHDSHPSKKTEALSSPQGPKMCQAESDEAVSIGLFTQGPRGSKAEQLNEQLKFHTFQMKVDLGSEPRLPLPPGVTGSMPLPQCATYHQRQQSFWPRQGHLLQEGPRHDQEDTLKAQLLRGSAFITGRNG